VIGGTLLTGGVGYVIGSVFGVGILGTIQTLITFDGTLSSWWTRIVIGALLCAFCLMQRATERHAARRKSGGTGIGAPTAKAARPQGSASLDEAQLATAPPRA
jgi:galactofuranose transport system permease protein